MVTPGVSILNHLWQGKREAISRLWSLWSCAYVWFRLVWFSLIWFGVVWLGLVWFSLVWLGSVWLGFLD